jgi:phage N-6-adenine-methyltransferase
VSLLPVSDIDTGERFRKDMGDLPGLAASIDAVGLLHPIVVMGQPNTSRWLLVAGERRLRACRDLLHWERIHVRIVPGTIDLLRAERDENEVREPFTPSEAVAIAAALRPVEQAAARERMAEGARSATVAAPAESRERIAAAVGMSHTTLTKATEVVEAVAENPVLAPIQEAMDESGNVAGAHAAVEAVAAEPTPERVEAVAEAVRTRTRITTGMMSSRSDEWHTPPSIIDRVRTALLDIDLDPCADAERKVPAAQHFTSEDDGLSRPWSGRVFMNPPYGDAISGWIDKLAVEVARGDVTEAVSLLPSRTDTGWWSRVPGDVVCFVTGRLRFSGADPAPFPSAVVYVGGSPDRFIAAFADAGLIYRRVQP